MRLTVKEIRRRSIPFEGVLGERTSVLGELSIVFETSGAVSPEEYAMIESSIPYHGASRVLEAQLSLAEEPGEPAGAGDSPS